MYFSRDVASFMRYMDGAKSGEADWHQWCEFGRADLMRRIKKPFWLYDLPEGVLKKNG